MATPLSADTIVRVLEAEGIDAYGHRSWRTNNRNHVGAWGQVYGVMIHHTVSSGDSGSVELCYNGHSRLPGPLCHGVGRNDGRIALVGHGRANHAGSGDGDVLRAVINETALPPDNQANTDGNRSFYGLEIVNLGNGTDTYTWAQYVAAVKWATAHCRAHGWSEKSVIGHSEWQPGKIDPYGPVVGPDGKRFSFTMARFRADVKAALAQAAGKWQGGSTVPPTEEEDVALTDAEIERIAERVWQKDGVVEAPVEGSNTHWAAKSYARNTYLEAQRARFASERLNGVSEALVRLEGKVDQVSVGGVDLDALAAKVADVLAARLEQ